MYDCALSLATSSNKKVSDASVDRGDASVDCGDASVDTGDASVDAGDVSFGSGDVSFSTCTNMRSVAAGRLRLKSTMRSRPIERFVSTMLSAAPGF